jgi:hypothetical protein
MIIVAAALLVAVADVDLRSSFVSCLKSASNEAVHQKIALGRFVDFARSRCAGTEEPFKAALTNANVQHGMSRKDSALDASQQLTDYYNEWKDKYTDDAPPPAAAVAAPKPETPASTPASAPTEPK